MPNKLIKDVILKVKYELNISWLGFEIQESINANDYAKVAEQGASLTKQSKALLRLNELYEGNKVAHELHAQISKRNAHMIDSVDVKFVKKKYGYILDGEDFTY